MIRRGEIYWVDFRGALGAEIRKIAARRGRLDDTTTTSHMQTVTVVAVLFAERPGPSGLTRSPIPAGVIGDGRPSRLKTHQLRAVDKSRVGRKIGVLAGAS